MKQNAAIEEVNRLKHELNRVRALSLSATRQNDFRAIARLTSEAARLNRAIHVRQDLNERSVAVIDAILDVSEPGQFVFPQMEEPVAA
jgi:hypothetical protein